MPDLARAAKALERMAILLEIKSIGDVTQSFQSDLTDLINAFFKKGKGSFAPGMRLLLNSAVPDAYYEGLAEGGVDGSELDKEDANNIKQALDEQLGYVKQFDSDMRAAVGDKDAEAAMLDRVDLWVASLNGVYQKGLASAKANEMVTWKLGDAEKHCKDCPRLDGQRHRRSWFDSRGYTPGVPGSATECGGYNCDCSLE